MSEKVWTPDQKLALTARDRSLVVSAAAGSGKTSVLTRRILDLIAEGRVDPARLVVVTFTRAAAGELQTRLYEDLGKEVAAHPERHDLARALLRLNRAKISTIHSFCLSLIQRYKKQLDLGANLRVADPQETELLRKKAAELAVSAFFGEKDGEEQERRDALLYLFGSGRSLDGILGVLIQLSQRVTSFPGGFSLLRDRLSELERERERMAKGEIPYGKTRLGSLLAQGARERFCQVSHTLRAMEKTLASTQTVWDKYGPDFLEKAERLDAAVTLLDRGELFQAGKIAMEVFQGSLPTVSKCPPEEKDIKEECQGIYNEQLKKPLLNFCKENLFHTEPEMLREVEDSIFYICQILSLAEKMETIFVAMKREKGLVDYSDLETLALSLLAEKREGQWHKTSVAQEVAGELDAIFVDEYQDSNSIQDLIFRMVSNGKNLFIVGDPKQSIYRFRGAEPSIFSQYKQNLPRYPHKGEGMQKILLSDNFRCDEPVIDFVNEIFRVMMDENAPESLYGTEDHLRFSKGKQGEKPPVLPEIVLVEKPETEDEKRLTPEQKLVQDESREAAYIAGRILEILSREPEREPEDIAVICRTWDQIVLVRSALTTRGIPCTAGPEEDIKASPEFLFVRALIRALDNPTRDIPLVGALFSPVFRFDADDLFRLRKAFPRGSFFAALTRCAKSGQPDSLVEKCRETLEILRQVQSRARNLTLPALIFYLYGRFAIEELYGGTGKVQDLLLDLADRAQKREFSTLSQFSLLLEEEKDGESEVLGEGVRLLTIHKSKGLEFPVVFVSFLGRYFSTKDQEASLLISQQFGLIPTLPALSGRAKVDSLLRKGAKFQMNRDNLEEAKRVLYVALTRAKETLILTAAPQYPASLARELILVCSQPLERELTSFLIHSCKTPLALILLSLRHHDGLRRVLRDGGTAREKNFVISSQQPAPFARYEKRGGVVAAESFTLEEILPALDFVYPQEELVTLPEKLSVSQILKEEREEEEEGAYSPLRLLDFEEGKLRSSAAKIGTATHQVMQFLDLKKAASDLEGECRRLVSEGFLSPEDMALVEKDKLASFFQSPLYKKLAASPQVEHEKRFNVLLPAEELIGRRGEVLVQGVVDAWFENPDGSLTLVDFKTDRVRGKEGEEILRQRHAQQLRLYRRAVEEISEKKVTELFLYSFSLGREIAVPLEEE